MDRSPAIAEKRKILRTTEYDFTVAANSVKANKSELNTQILAWYDCVVRFENFSARELCRVAWLIADLIHHEKGYAFPNFPYVADALQVTTKAVQRAVDDLEHFGFLRVRRKRGCGNLYTINPFMKRRKTGKDTTVLPSDKNECTDDTEHTENFEEMDEAETPVSLPMENVGSKGTTVLTGRTPLSTQGGHQRPTYPPEVSPQITLPSDARARESAIEGARAPTRQQEALDDTQCQHDADTQGSARKESEGYVIRKGQLEFDAWLAHWRARGDDESDIAEVLACGGVKVPTLLPPAVNVRDV